MGKSGKVRASQREEAPPEKPPATLTRRGTESELLDQAIEKIKKDLNEGKVKGSVGDLIRLLQLRKELEEEEPREIKVSWVEPHEEGHAGEK